MFTIVIKYFHFQDIQSVLFCFLNLREWFFCSFPRSLKAVKSQYFPALLLVVVSFVHSKLLMYTVYVFFLQLLFNKRTFSLGNYWLTFTNEAFTKSDCLFYFFTIYPHLVMVLLKKVSSASFIKKKMHHMLFHQQVISKRRTRLHFSGEEENVFFTIM